MTTTPRSLEEAQALLQRQQQEIERLQAAHESLMRAVAHDLRAPLRHVVSFAPLLCESVEELAAAAPQAVDAAEDAREFAGTMEQAARKMSLMLDGMAQVSRAARAPLNFAVVDWSALAQQVVAPWQAKHPQVQWQLPSLAAPVMADSEWLRMATQALVENAVKFSAKQAAPVVQLQVQALPTGWWQLSVQDNGAGFDDSRAQSLGELFQRMHTEKAFEGVGCGLALVSTIVQRHGARWRIQAQSEQGCTVVLEWPGAA